MTDDLRIAPPGANPAPEIVAMRKAEEARARLNDAAPDMLAALKKAEELFMVGLIAAPRGLYDEVNRLRRAAIAKAEGSAQ